MNPNPGTFLKYCEDLERKLAEQVGYLHRSALEKYHARKQIFPAYENDDLCGYLLFNDTPGRRLAKRRPTTCTIYQAAIQYDAQRIHHGTNLVDQVITRARRSGLYFLDCWVTSTIPANDFWKAIGFDLLGSRPGGRKRKRTLNHYRLRLPANPQTPRIDIPRITLPNPEPQRHPYNVISTPT